MEQSSSQPHTEKVLEHLQGLEGWLAPKFEQLPHIPEKGRKVLVDIVPWLTLVFGLFGAVSLITGGFVLTVATLFSGGFALMYLGGFILPMLCSAAAVALTLMAFPGLKSLKKTGWNLLFYSEMVSVAGGVLGLLSGNIGMLISTALGAGIGLWILFEIRSYYHA